jgi:branched-chain amino acid transport system permease protein
VLLGTALVVFVRQYGDPLEEQYTIATWLNISAVALFVSAAGLVLFRYLRRLRPRFHRGTYILAGAGLTALVLGIVDPGFIEGSFRGFGMRAIFLSLLLIVIMVFRPEGITGRAEFSWAALFGERRDQPTDEEREQDAWLTNPALAKRLEEAEQAARGETPRDTSDPPSDREGGER